MGKASKLALAGVAVLAVAVVIFVATGGSDEETSTASSTTSESAKDTFVFGASAEPALFDAPFANEGESARVITQIVESLVTLKPGTLEVQPSLATSWKDTDGGRTWTFNLRKGVKFHDGTPFNAQAVCDNFDRWADFKGPQQTAAYSYSVHFGGFKTGPSSKSANFAGCEAPSDDVAVIKLKEPYGPFLQAMATYYYAIQSPTAMKKYGADEPASEKDGAFVPGGTYALEHPTGTGPYKFKSWVPGDNVTLVRNDDYWGKKAIIPTVIIRPIADPAARLQALQSGELDGYDNPDPQTYPTIEGDGNLKVEAREPFNIGFIGINASIKPFDKREVRQAVAYGLDREKVVNTFYKDVGEVATQFETPNLFGYNPDVPKYSYDPEKSKELLQKAGLKLPVPVEFWYPTDVSRPYMPNPKRNFEAFAQSLNEAGFKVIPKTAPWNPDYTGKVYSGKTGGGLFMLGYINDHPDPNGFLSGNFANLPEFGLTGKEPYLAKMDAAKTETDVAKRTPMYEEINSEIMTEVPAVPYVYAKTGVALRKDVEGYVTSPTTAESFATVYVAPEE